jgi:glyoxylase-like metal-dependent hydrolase (beta-lactamase superfamily II)
MLASVGMTRAQAAQPLFGTVSISLTSIGGVRLHSYMAGGDSFFVNSHIIETPNALVLVDAQFALPYAQNFRAYAESLGKPIERIIVSHAHPDHYLGLEVFADAPQYALPGVIEGIAAFGPATLANVQGMMGNLVPAELTIPTEALDTGSLMIDGVTLELENVLNGEAAEQLVIRLPEQQTIIVQDLAYNNLHLYLGNNTMASWQETLTSLGSLEGYRRVLVGHGEPTDPAIFTANARYLRDALTIQETAADAEAFRSELLTRYPDARSAGLLDLYLPLLYPAS